MYLPKTITIKFKFEEFFSKYYQPTDDCIILDKQIGDLKKELEFVSKMSTSGFNGFMVKKVKAKILELIKTRENQFALMDCRNKIETKRQTETATIFTETSEEAEKRVLTQTKTKQYVLLGVGSLVLLGTLVIILKNRKK